jgi:hypothetical protein
MSFQITVLKVLAGHPEGRLSLADLRRAVAILISSGPDWAGRTKRLLARSPDVDIFRQSFVLRDEAGWQITTAGREFLAFVETPIGAAEIEPIEKPPEVVVMLVPAPTSAMQPVRPVALTRNRQRRHDRAANRARHTAAQPRRLLGRSVINRPI